MTEKLIGKRIGKTHFLRVGGWMFDGTPFYVSACSSRLASGSINNQMTILREATAADVDCSRCTKKGK